MSRESVNAQIDTDITNKTAEASVTAVDVGSNMKSVNNRIEVAVSANVQNNLLPSATMSPSVNAVNAGLESYANDVQAQIDAGIAGVYKDAGNYNASVGTFPTQTAQGNPIEAGNLFTVSVAGTLGGVNYAVGEAFRALVDTPGQTAGNWQKLIFIAGAQTVDTAGLVRKATDAEVVAGTANDNSVSTKQLQDKLDNLPSSVSTLQQVTTAGNTIISGNNKTEIFAGQYSVENTSSQAKVEHLATGIRFWKNFVGTGLRNIFLSSPDTQATDLTVKLPTESGTLAIQKYKSYVALISQSGTSAPTVTVIHNDIGNIVFSRDTVGTYRATLPGAFPANKTFIPNAKYAISGEEAIHLGVAYYRVDNNYIGFNSYFNANEEDGILQGESLEIRVYN